MQREEVRFEERWTEAMEVLKQVLLADPEHAGAHFLLGMLKAWWSYAARLPSDKTLGTSWPWEVYVWPRSTVILN